MKKILKAAVAVATCLAMNSAFAQVGVDPQLPDYQAVPGVSGKLNSVGSDTLNNLMTLWGEKFKEYYPNVAIEIEGKGSSTAPPALIEGTSQLGPMSREMKGSEIDAFEQRYGYKPLMVPVSIDALAVFVNKDNPIAGLALQQIDSIFSSTYKRGGQDISAWGQAGMSGAWARTPISIYGRNSASGTYGFFKSVSLLKGDYKATVKEMPGSSAVVQSIGNERGAIGYSGIGYLTASVRALPLSETGTDYVAPTAENCLSGDYPLARFLQIYVNKKPNEELDLLTKEFLKFVLSKQGQEIVVKDGYFPLPAEAAAMFRATLD